MRASCSATRTHASRVRRFVARLEVDEVGERQRCVLDPVCPDGLPLGLWLQRQDTIANVFRLELEPERLVLRQRLEGINDLQGRRRGP